MHNCLYVFYVLKCFEGTTIPPHGQCRSGKLGIIRLTPFDRDRPSDETATHQMHSSIDQRVTAVHRHPHPACQGSGRRWYFSRARHASHRRMVPYCSWFTRTNRIPGEPHIPHFIAESHHITSRLFKITLSRICDFGRQSTQYFKLIQVFFGLVFWRYRDDASFPAIHTASN